MKISSVKIISLLFFVLSAFYLYTAYQIQVFSFDENAPFNAKTFPIYLGYAGMFLAGLKIILPERLKEEGGLLHDGLLVEGLLDRHARDGHHGQPPVLELGRLHLALALVAGAEEVVQAERVEAEAAAHRPSLFASSFG